MNEQTLNMITIDFYFGYLLIVPIFTIWASGGSLGYHVIKYAVSNEEMNLFLESLNPILRYYYRRRVVYDIPNKNTNEKNMKLADYIKLNDHSKYREKRLMGLIPPSLMILMLLGSSLAPVSLEERTSNLVVFFLSLVYFRSVWYFGSKLSKVKIHKG